jgi:1-acyl-sn-glycerol-3-phosphate acyltransferase
MIEQSSVLNLSSQESEEAAGGIGAKAMNSLRLVLRLANLALWAVQSSLDFLFFVGLDRKRTSAARRAWMRRTARGALKVLKVDVSFEGRPPRHGLLVSNHLSYLDVVVLASIVPAIFVAKKEVRSWPVFGWFARCAGTIFVDRQSRYDVGRVTREMHETLDLGAVVVLFPEGTSSAGTSVLPFRSSLLEPLRSPKHLAGVAAIDYQLPDGCVQEEVCYWGDHNFGAHLLNLLTKKKVQAKVRFGLPHCPLAMSRKQLASDLRESVVRLRNGGPTGFTGKIFHETEV